MRQLFLITFYHRRDLRKCKSNGSVFTVSAKKLLNPPQGRRVPVVSVLNKFKNKELFAVSGQESVVLDAEVKQLGNCLHRGVNFPKLSCLSCARQVVRVAHFCTVITSCCNEHLEKLVDSSDQCKTPTSSSYRPAAARSPTGESPSAKRNKDRNTIKGFLSFFVS